MINVRLLGDAGVPSGDRSALVYLTSPLHFVHFDLREILTDYLAGNSQGWRIVSQDCAG